MKSLESLLFLQCVIPSNKIVFYRLLMSSEELRLFDKIRVFLDEDYSSAEHFTVCKSKNTIYYVS